MQGKRENDAIIVQKKMINKFSYYEIESNCFYQLAILIIILPNVL